MPGLGIATGRLRVPVRGARRVWLARVMDELPRSAREEEECGEGPGEGQAGLTVMVGDVSEGGRHGAFREMNYGLQGWEVRLDSVMSRRDRDYGKG